MFLTRVVALCVSDSDRNSPDEQVCAFVLSTLNFELSRRCIEAGRSQSQRATLHYSSVKLGAGGWGGGV